MKCLAAEFMRVVSRERSALNTPSSPWADEY